MFGATADAGTTVSARLVHADGSVEELGIISRNGRPVRSSWIRAIIERMKRHGK